jgi:hypothetical protein
MMRFLIPFDYATCRFHVNVYFEACEGIEGRFGTRGLTVVVKSAVRFTISKTCEVKK